MIKKTVCYDLSPTLHIVEARVVECPSGPSPAEFLMVSLFARPISFHRCFAISKALRKRVVDVSSEVVVE